MCSPLMGAIRKDGAGNPKCARCSDSVIKKDFQVTWIANEYPSINMGPYCPDCIAFVKVCTNCHYPFDADSTILTRDYDRVCINCAEG